MEELIKEYKLSQYEDIKALDKNGRVFLVKNSETGKEYIKKMVSEGATKIYEEIKNIRCLYIAEVYDIINDGKNYWVIEEYIRGRELKEIIKEKGRLECDEVIDIVIQICDGLRDLHKLKIIHRDISPNNIIITNKNCVKLIDFGIARIKKEESRRDTTILGTVGYAAPEQFGFEQTTMAADIYSIGVLMNVMLTGRFTFEEMYKGNIDYIIKKCIQLNPKDRYKNVDDLKRALLNSTKVTGKIGNMIAELPGYRTGNIVKELVATVIYSVTGFFLFITFITAFDGDSETIWTLALFITLSLFGSFLVGANYYNYMDKIPLIKNCEKETKDIFAICLGVASLAICWVVMNKIY